MMATWRACLVALALAVGASGAAAKEQPAARPAGDAGGKEAASEPAPDVADAVVSAGQFRTLATALQAAGLMDLLKGKGPYTLFAPTDAAFSKLPPGTLEGLLDHKPRLVELMKRHVVTGKLPTAQIGKRKTVKSLAGAALQLESGEGGVKVNDAAVVQADLPAQNGVIHAIDSVLVPADLWTAPTGKGRKAR